MSEVVVDHATGEILSHNGDDRLTYWAGRLNAGAERSAAAILEWASDVCEALTECTEEELAPRLTFSVPTISKLRAIGNHYDRFFRARNLLPASRETLYELTQLSDEQWALAETTGGKGGRPLLRPDVERKEVTYFRNYREREIKAAPPPLPAGTFDLIYADPPWQYDFSKSGSREIENQYPTMSVEEICDLRSEGRSVEDLAAENCVLFLWTTSPKLIDGLRVVNAWGFTYKTCAVWDKERMGMGYYFRQRHELLLVATRGAPPAPAPEDRPESIIRSPREEHSRKPAIVRSMLERMYPSSTRVELFSREEHEGWERWGNQGA